MSEPSEFDLGRLEQRVTGLEKSVERLSWLRDTLMVISAIASLFGISAAAVVGYVYYEFRNSNNFIFTSEHKSWNEVDVPQAPQGGSPQGGSPQVVATITHGSLVLLEGYAFENDNYQPFGVFVMSQDGRSAAEGAKPVAAPLTIPELQKASHNLSWDVNESGQVSVRTVDSRFPGVRLVLFQPRIYRGECHK
jgi:hypothetical protein